MWAWHDSLLRGLAVVVLVAGGLLAAPAPAAAAERCFGETSYCVRGRFLTYWLEHGGLAINGYPISDERIERLEDGRPRLVQYFERVRMELHPENPTPYTILLGHFGRRIRPADRPAAPLAGATYFSETGHNLSQGFRRFWQTNGGLAQFGYPISEELQERLDDGVVHTVQYFERARFEWHPTNRPPYDLLLAHFGRRMLSGATVVAPCNGIDLRGQIIWEGAAGSRIGTVSVINDGPSTCALYNRPAVRLFNQDGGQLSLTVVNEPAANGTEVGVVALPSGWSATLPMRWTNYCGPALTAVTVNITLTNGTVVNAPAVNQDGQPTGDHPPCNGPGQPSTLFVRPFDGAEPSVVAANVVLDHFAAINARDFAQAYAAFGSALRARQTYESFVAGQTGTQRVRASIGYVAGTSAPGVLRVSIALAALQTNGTTINFAGTYDIGRESGRLKIIGANVARLT